MEEVEGYVIGDGYGGVKKINFFRVDLYLFDKNIFDSNMYYLDFLFGLWVRAEAATDFTAAGVFGFDNSLAALLATAFDVCSPLGILMGFVELLNYEI